MFHHDECLLWWQGYMIVVFLRCWCCRSYNHHVTSTRVFCLFCFVFTVIIYTFDLENMLQILLRMHQILLWKSRPYKWVVSATHEQTNKKNATANQNQNRKGTSLLKILGVDWLQHTSVWEMAGNSELEDVNSKRKVESKWIYWCFYLCLFSSKLF